MHPSIVVSGVLTQCVWKRDRTHSPPMYQDIVCLCDSAVPLFLILSSLPPSLLSADTPIEEFTPTPAFPALQYLESVDEGGVAWQAGLRTGDFLIEVR